MTTGVGGCGGGCSDDCPPVLVPKQCVLERGSPTPAQAAAAAQRAGTYGDWVDDVPIQGPTNRDMRAAGCWYKNNVLNKATDMQGAIVPQWTQNQLCIGNRLTESGVGGVGEVVWRGGRVVGALGQTPASAGASPPAGAPAPAPTTAPATTPPAGAPPPTAPAAPPAGPPPPPGIWGKLSAAESHWVAATLIRLNDLIVKAGNKPCATWPADLLKDDATATAKMPAAVSCFQGWANTNLKLGKILRIDGTLDGATLCALVETTRRHAADFPDSYPGNTLWLCGWSGLSTPAKVGVVAGAVAVVGGAAAAIAAASGKKKRAPEPAGA